MRSQHISVFLPSVGGGGAERVMVILANEFANKGHKVDLVLARAVGEYVSEVSSKVNVIDLNAVSVGASLLPLVKYLIEKKPDAMLTALNYVNVIAIFAKLIARSHVRLVISERSNLSNNIKFSKGLSARLVFPLVKLTYKFADAIVAVSKGVANDLLEHVNVDNKKLFVVYNPVVDASIFKHASAQVSHKWIESKNVPVILAAGRLNPAKDFFNLIKAFSYVREKIKCKLIILGEGDQRQALEKFVIELGLKEDIDLPGFAENPFSFMKNSNLFVLSSLYEGLPNVLIQALACGVPVVSTDCPSGPAEILENGRWGRLVPTGNSEELANAMMQALESSLNDLPKGRERAMEFNYECAVDSYLRILLNDSIYETK